ncbi:LysM peptidoglycan-binding domain-containing protein [Fructilactobacillus sanfranciscensis]|uniref:Peptidase M23 n=1 Tax=Fructilactobacillus sanfranciscensis TaxID=1625 RepID=A0A5C4TJG8_FRUSA|nr:LysM peptidoglycan-binding domain-containing protein [Fructilactobacillus sanfranciscensis]TNK90720.1 peptidase M23 [Fructilactobacillus sanfranciscensis]TNK95748.1 peptidase M23 [Fructilactobacillus sanfranciscensis]TNL00269.1 peptidase M23 [Fructilactobacillus sanfranciscensis]WED57642.1 LysM peptidoglycan-binding domain-containing protein [Fructilactobacillus sanfranciscensis]
MKFTKSIAVMAAISVGIMFAVTANVDANAKVKHTVQNGDTISGLSQQYHVSQKKIQKANKGKDINTIYVGEVFVFDGKGHVKIDKNSAKAPVNTNSSNANTQTTASAANTSSVAAPQATTQSAAPVQQAPSAPVAAAAPTSPAPAASAPVASNGTMDGIAQAESGNNYNARNGQYIGKYQLSASYLNGDYSPAHQEEVAQQYAVSRYGSVQAAAAYHAAHGSW